MRAIKEVVDRFYRIACVIAVGAITAVSATADAHPVFLGPANPGAESGLDGWCFGAIGGGAVAVDKNDPATGSNDFSIANAASGPKKHADLRCESFSLQSAGKTGRPITLSFAYKLPGKVKPGDNIALDVRFFKESDANDCFVGEKRILIGSSTDDSAMTQYKTMTVPNIIAPSNAVTADISITANVSEPWTSGAAQFDDISVTTAAAQVWAKEFAALASLLMGPLYVRYNRNRYFKLPPTAQIKCET